MRTFLIVLSLLVGPLTTTAWPHVFLDHLVGSTVASAPHEVTLSFTQELTSTQHHPRLSNHCELEPAFSTVAVTDGSGARVDQGKPRISASTMSVALKTIGPGTYRVRWHVLSVDTHKTEGSFTFRVGSP